MQPTTVRDLLDEAGRLPAGSAQQLNMYGRIWCGYVKMAPGSGVPNGDRKLIVDAVNAELAPFGVELTRGYNDSEPVVRCQGHKSSSYADLFRDVSAQPDGGQGTAQRVLQWLDGTLPLSSFTVGTDLEVCVATQLCEAGRGYTQLLGEFRDLLEAIAMATTPQDARTKWRQIARVWTPATQAKSDARTDWQPTPGDDADESISDSS
ncbi:MAG: hypothetical protein HOV68_15375 [Streptomycetaceae bacterium]|nr:hypothetical protein [Streptomycetaceae bacterium]